MVERYVREYENNCVNVSTICTSDTERLSSVLDASGIKLLHHNIRSLNKNLDSLLILLKQLRSTFDFVVLSETWKLYDPLLFRIDQYDILYNEGSINQNDGVVVYVRSNSSYNHRIHSVNGLNFLIVDSISRGETIKLIAVYRPHTISKDVFNKSLTLLFNDVKMTSDVNLFVGDINIDLFSDESGTQEYQNILSEQGLLSAVNGITRPQSGTCVDHIFFKTGITVENVISLTLQVDITDHYPVALVLARDQSVSKRQILKTKKIIKYADLNESLREELWTEAYESQNIDVAAEAFVDRLKLLIERSTSSIKLIRKRKDWITPGIMKSIEKKNHMYKQMKHGRSSDPDMIGRYRQYKNHIEKLIRITKVDYYRK